MATITHQEEDIQTTDEVSQSTNDGDPAIDYSETEETEAGAHVEGEYIPDTHLPDPSIWPFVIAVGLAILMAGIVIHLVVVLVGLAVFVFGIGGWLYQDIQVARRQEHH
jgi:hypothetical protein